MTASLQAALRGRFEDGSMCPADGMGKILRTSICILTCVGVVGSAGEGPRNTLRRLLETKGDVA